MDYEGQQIEADGYKKYFKGTFKELMQSNHNQLVLKIQHDLQFMKNVWFSDSETKHLIVTDNNIIYYFNIDDNTISIYANVQTENSWYKQQRATNEFIDNLKNRWNEEQKAIRTVFGNDYRIYYTNVDFFNDPNKDLLNNNIDTELYNE